MSNYFWYLGIAPPHGAAIGEAVRGSRRVVHSTTTEEGGVLVVVFCISSCQSFDVFFPFAVRWLVGVEGVEVLKLKREGVIKCFFKMFGLLGR